MAVLQTLTSPQTDTFRVLGLRSNLASVEVLGHALGSSYESVRLAALKSLIARGGEAEMATIVERIDCCNESELPLLVNQVTRLLAPIEAGLASRDSMRHQRSLCAIAKLQIASQFHHLVRVAQSAQDPQQIVAAELVLSLARMLGSHSRRGREKQSEPLRLQILEDLSRSMEMFDEHRITQIFEAWLCASHWDDEAFKSLFSPGRRDGVSKVALRQLKHSHRAETIELTVGILWSKSPCYDALQFLGERKDQATAIDLADMVIWLGVTPNVSKNIVAIKPFHALDNFDFSSPAHSIEHRCAWLQLLKVADTTPDRLLESINDLLSTNTPQAEKACAMALRNLRSLRPEVVVMVLSDCFENPDLEPYEPPPWKSKLKAALERLFGLYPLQPPSVRSSIEYAFSDFQCDELSKHVDDWPEPHLAAYGKMVRIAEQGHIEFLEREAMSQSAAKRARAIRVIRIVGVIDELREVLVESLRDKNESVRIEAVYAIADGHDRREAIAILTPLLQDDDGGVKVAVNLAISQLES